LEINNAGNTANYIQAFDGGAVTLYHNNAAKLATTATGIDVTGDVGGDTLTISGAGSVQGLTVGRGAGAVATNTAVGASALAANTSGDYATAVGSEAGNKNTTGRFLVAIGRQAGYNNLSGNSNTAVGESSFFTNTAGADNTAIGQAALYTNTASQNTGVGSSALLLNSSGTANSALGYQALRSNTTASNNTAVGYQAGYANTTGTSNTFLGYSAGIGTTTGNYNTMVGRAAGLGLTEGSANTFVGGYDASTGGSGAEITTGSNNTILGAYNGNQGGLDIRTSDNNIVLSDGDGNPRVMVNSLANVGVTTVPSASASGPRLYVENTHNTSGDLGIYSLLGGSCSDTSSIAFSALIAGVGNKFNVYGNGNVVNTNNSYGAISDVKLKENIIDASSQWDDIKNLTVRKYSMKADSLDAPNMLGVIAQEVEAAGMAGLVYESPDRDADKNDLGTVTKQVNYSILYMKAVKALQEAMTRIETLEAQNASFEARITALET
jgi:trimeric autotransporter adhesin